MDILQCEVHVSGYRLAGAKPERLRIQGANNRRPRSAQLAPLPTL
jgi:hypothetical protein